MLKKGSKKDSVLKKSFQKRLRRARPIPDVGGKHLALGGRAEARRFPGVWPHNFNNRGRGLAERG